ncbi:MAG TPA: SRPBCC family protein, partial [Acidimicrobiales bacterium]|nr:SRPBCC family protein [Acidimicrobiales bacterium]
MARSPYVIDYRGSFTLAVPPAVVWRAIERGERFETWWAWLREFRLDGGRIVPGAVLRGVVVPPVPYTMRVRVEIDACDPPTSIDATVGGDIEGPAHLVLHDVEGGTRAEVAWTIEMRTRAMRLAARAAHPLLRWGHDRVVEATVDGFRRHLTGDGGR